MHYFLQVTRPLTMKKEGIQTRNRKITTKKKRRRDGSIIHNELKPSGLETLRPFGIEGLRPPGLENLRPQPVEVLRPPGIDALRPSGSSRVSYSPLSIPASYSVPHSVPQYMYGPGTSAVSESLLPASVIQGVPVSAVTGFPIGSSSQIALSGPSQHHHGPSLPLHHTVRFLTQFSL